ncbi:hypothetical protein BMR1_03g01196 [Babesia microti strain RI]|uniref:RRM domain-containing protein n=1 Tax=Babesia microti (strain RI) TaxID=1133968 RepID=A0A1R4ABC2_BABMR|nr:hypothetical protein BMR1_03g01196 [Babesia microti strain RI]SJK86321.1 hypothetical protein BMR1_03g01196 [Babesia microti strain RI]|eukprot:XP_021338493.1 hypothetical protein BMR1_03g01196 [Babesia microti strain RI]
MYNSNCTFYRLVLKGLPYNVTKTEILTLLQNYKTDISDVILNTGYAYVDFHSESVLRKVKDFVRGKYIGNRPVVGKLYVQHPEYQYRTSWRRETSRRHIYEH